jgi:hypothetical protein
MEVKIFICKLKKMTQYLVAAFTSLKSLHDKFSAVHRYGVDC